VTEQCARNPYALLGDRNFGPFVAANFVSNIGNWFHIIAAVLLIYELTQSAFMTGLVSIMTFGAFLLLSPLAGGVTDRFDRRRLLMVTQAGAGLFAGVLALWAWLTGASQVWPVLAITGLMGVAQVFSIPTMMALVPALVPEKDLSPAIALNTVGINVARALGPALAGVVTATADVSVAFAVNAASFFVLVAALAAVAPRRIEEAGEHERSAEPDGNLWAGARYVWRDRRLCLLLLGVASIGVAMDPTSTLTAPLASLFGGGEALVGWFVSAFGAGAVLASVVADRLGRVVPLVSSGAGGLALCSVALVALAASPTRVVALVAFGLLGAGYLLGITDITTEMQRRSPGRLRGRVMALWSQVLLGSRPVAAALTGGLADAASPRLSAVVAALVPLAAALAVGARRRASVGGETLERPEQPL
jgi:MFS family permease